MVIGYMPMKNYSTTVAAEKSISQIQSILAKHGVKRMMLEYDDYGNASGLAFVIDGVGSFQLPARVENVQAILKKQKVSSDKRRATNTAWRNIKDWVDAQIALIETGQIELQEAMLPYLMTGNNETLYMKMRDNSMCATALKEGDE